MDKRFWGFLVLLVVILGGIFAFNNNKAAAPSSTKGVLTNHVQGQGKTGVKLVEYGDFQCPACGQYYAVVKQVAEKYNTEISFQFRNFPLYQIHPNAIASARAAEAADMQGKYWEMHDLLYENQQSWSAATNSQTFFEKFASSLGLDVPRFRKDFKSTAVNDRVQADLKEGTRLHVESTPTFFIDGKKISNPNPGLEDFSKVIDAEIVKKGGTPPAATTSPAAPASSAPIAPGPATTTPSGQ